MSRQFEQPMGESDWQSTLGDGEVSVDVADRDDEYVATADLPGFAEDDIEVTIRDDVLRIEAEHEESTAADEDTDEGRYIRRERRHQSASRSVTLPEPVEAASATARYHNGVLTVTLPKAGDQDSHRIDIS